MNLSMNTSFGRILKNKYYMNLVKPLYMNSVNMREIYTKSWAKKERKNDLISPYEQLFPWKSLSDFSEDLLDNMLYFDGHLLAICKPWGVGTYKSTVNITDKNSYLSRYQYYGSTNYCLIDSIEYIRQKLGLKNLKIVKTLNRFMSGIVLMATDDITENKVLKSIRSAKHLDKPAMSFWCTTKGWPTIEGNHLTERIGIKLLETDELGDHKEPIIISSQDLTNCMRRRKIPQRDGMIVKPVLIDLNIIDINKSLSVSLVELSTNTLKWNLIECYLAFKTSFVLGDNRFCRRVKHILGTPLSIKPNKLSYSEEIEPLPNNICKKLMVKNNSYIPVQIHHKRLVLPLYLSKKEKKDLVIETDKIPDYFEFTLKNLELNKKHKN